MSKTVSSAREEKWREILKSILGRPWAKHYNAISTNIEAVNCGLKLGFLWDLGPTISIGKLSTLVQELKSVGLLFQDIYLVEINTDYILVDIQKFLTINNVQIKSNYVLPNTPKESQPISPNITKFIDVGIETDAPQFVKPESENYEIIEKMIKSLMRYFREYVDAPNGLHLHLKIENGWCIPTIFGILLDYPVVYWYRFNQNNHCLSLTVYQLITETNSILCAFSIPTGLEASIQDYLRIWYQVTVVKNSYSCSTAGINFNNLRLATKCVTVNFLVL